MQDSENSESAMKPPSTQKVYRPENSTTLNGNGKKAIRLEDLNLEPEALSRLDTRSYSRKIQGIRKNTCRALFVFGMVFGSILSVLLPVSVAKLHIGLRVAIYLAIVYVFGCVWRNIALRYCDKNYPLTEEEKRMDGKQVYRLD